MLDKPNYYAILPANVRYDKELQPIARLLYAEISCLTNSTGICTASNEYFANLYDMHPVSISRIVNKLKLKNYITVHYSVYGSGDDRKEIREIKLTKTIADQIIDNSTEKSKKTRTPKVKEEVPMFEKEFVRLTNKKYIELVHDYGETIVLTTIDRMIVWCRDKSNYYKDYGKALAKWLEPVPKLTDVVEVKKEVKEYKAHLPLFDVQEE